MKSSAHLVQDKFFSCHVLHVPTEIMALKPDFDAEPGMKSRNPVRNRVVGRVTPVLIHTFLQVPPANVVQPEKDFSKSYVVQDLF